MSEIPSGNIDIAPTVLAILGIAPPHRMDGRVLREAMTEGETPLMPERTTYKTSREIGGGRRWQQYLTVSRVGSVLYFDEGNGESSAK